MHTSSVLRIRFDGRNQVSWNDIDKKTFSVIEAYINDKLHESLISHFCAARRGFPTLLSCSPNFPRV